MCPDGLLFEDGNPNQEKCDYPFNVECGVREYVRKLSMTKLQIFVVRPKGSGKVGR